MGGNQEADRTGGEGSTEETLRHQDVHLSGLNVDSIRLASWNLWWRHGELSAREPAILSTLRHLDADVIGLQEVCSREPDQPEWLRDELGVNLTDRSIRVNYEMVNGQTGPVACQSGTTDIDGYFDITCPLSDVMAGKAKVTVTYSAYDNNDAYRYENKTVQTEFDVFSNSTLQVTEVGPFMSSVDQYVAPNGSRYPVLYLKESFHVDAFLAQSNGQYVGGKCLNIYLDPEENIRPLATIRTSNIDGSIEWFSANSDQNPSLRGVETTGGKLEGFRMLRVAFEPDRNVPGGCDKDNSNALNGSAMDVEVLDRSLSLIHI